MTEFHGGISKKRLYALLHVYKHMGVSEVRGTLLGSFKGIPLFGRLYWGSRTFVNPHEYIFIHLWAGRELS